MTINRFLPIAAALLLVGCQAQNASTTAGGGGNAAEAAFTTNAFQVIDFDRQEGMLAQTQARNPRVKALAQQFTNQANEFATRLTPIAAASSIQPPTILRNDLRVRLGHMQAQQGLDFDRTYVADQIASHEEALRLQSMMNGASVSPAFMALMQQGQSLLQTNLETLRNLQREVGPARL